MHSFMDCLQVCGFVAWWILRIICKVHDNQYQCLYGPDNAHAVYWCIVNEKTVQDITKIRQSLGTQRHDR